MLRQKDVKKYKNKSKYDQLLFLRKDGEYLLKSERPIKDNLIKTMNQEKVSTFIEDILVNGKISRLLFNSNSKYEVNNYLNVKEKFFTHKTPLKPKNNDNITLKQMKKQFCIDIRNRIKIFRKERKKMTRSMDNINKERIKKFRKDLNEIEKLPLEEIKKNKLNGFIRSYNAIKKKFDIYKKINLYRNNSSTILQNYNKNKNNISLTKSIQKNNSILLKSISGDTYESEIKSNNISSFEFERNSLNYKNKLNKSLLPDAKLDRNDVFSRLYNNAFLLSPSTLIKNQRRAQSRILNNNSTTYIPKVILKLKKVIDSTSGKEFTVKINKDVIKKCFSKYSGGPSLFKIDFFRHKKEKNKNDYNKKDIKIDQDFPNDSEESQSEKVNYYKLIDKKTGNSFLHLAVLGGHEEFVKYFLEKNSNINLKNFDGNTPLHLALLNKKKCKNVINILMKYNPRLDIKNNNGDRAFDLLTDEMKIKYGLDKIIVGKENNFFMKYILKH